MGFQTQAGDGMSLYVFMARMLGWAVVAVVLLLTVAIAGYGSDACYTAPGVIVCEAFA